MLGRSVLPSAVATLTGSNDVVPAGSLVAAAAQQQRRQRSSGSLALMRDDLTYGRISLTCTCVVNSFSR